MANLKMGQRAAIAAHRATPIFPMTGNFLPWKGFYNMPFKRAPLEYAANGRGGRRRGQPSRLERGGSTADPWRSGRSDGSGVV